MIPPEIARGWQYLSGLPGRATMIVVLGIAGTTGLASDLPLFTDEEIEAKFAALEPKDSDFAFATPPGWTANLAARAPIVLMAPKRDDPRIALAVDGAPATTWTCKADGGKATVAIDLGKDVRLDRLVVFNRQTDNRGTAGGNNAVRRLALSVARTASPSTYEPLGEFALDGPRAICFKRKGGGQVCSFIDRVEPNLVTLSPTIARYVRVDLLEAFWGASAPPSWRSSVAVSELMLFDSKGGR